MQILVIPRHDLTADECKALATAIDGLLACNAPMQPSLDDHERASLENLRWGRLPDTWAEQVATKVWLEEKPFLCTYEQVLEDTRGHDSEFADSRAIVLGISEEFEWLYDEAFKLLRAQIPNDLVADVVLDQEFSWNDS